MLRCDQNKNDYAQVNTDEHNGVDKHSYVHKDNEDNQYQSSENGPCPPNDPTEACNPYANFVNIPGSRKGTKWRQSCDEFPFASSLQGGSGTSICIPGWQNSFQGFQLMGLKSDVGAGNDYVVQVTGWDCKTGRPTRGSAQNCRLNAGVSRKRDDLGGESLSQDDIFTNMTASGENALMIFIGDVDSGSYTFNLSIAVGTITAVHAVDGDGNTLDASVSGGTGTATLQASSDPYVVTVRVSEPAFDVALWALTRESQVELAYNLSYSAVDAPNTPPSSSMAGRKGSVETKGAEGARGLALLVFGILTGVIGGLLL
ncbi:hypothetical protein P885DRAFT_80000 [Corynascus similis CBS 632.67]